jgi:hypothetical protein
MDSNLVSWTLAVLIHWSGGRALVQLIQYRNTSQNLDRREECGSVVVYTPVEQRWMF